MTITFFRPTWVVTTDDIHDHTVLITVHSVHHNSWDASHECVALFNRGVRAYVVEVWHRPDSRKPKQGDQLELIRDGLDPIALAPADV